MRMRPSVEFKKNNKKNQPFQDGEQHVEQFQYELRRKALLKTLVHRCERGMQDGMALALQKAAPLKDIELEVNAELV